MSIKTSDHICPACVTKGLLLFYEIRNVPVDCASIFETRAEAEQIPCGDIVLGFCEKCGFIYNTAFDPSLTEIRGNYEDQQGFSPTFQRYAESVVDGLVGRYGLHDKLIVEIGCGKGDFLKLLCRRGQNRGIGIDPKADMARILLEQEQIAFIAELYAEKHGELDADLICCRHTLEHIHYPAEFIDTIRRSIGPDKCTPVFFELPDVTRILSETAFWDIYYEHCAYYGPAALSGLLERNGFSVAEIKRGYYNQHLLLNAIPAGKGAGVTSKHDDGIVEQKKNILDFIVQIGKHLGKWAAILKAASKGNKRVVIWGSGSKCVGFLSILPHTDNIEYIVDINPHRQEKFTPKFGQKIVSPQFLKRYAPDMVIVMNPVYLNEIKQQLKTMNLAPEVTAV